MGKSLPQKSAVWSAEIWIHVGILEPAEIGLSNPQNMAKRCATFGHKSTLQVAAHTSQPSPPRSDEKTATLQQLKNHSFDGICCHTRCRRGAGWGGWGVLFGQSLHHSDLPPSYVGVAVVWARSMAMSSFKTGPRNAAFCMKVDNHLDHFLGLGFFVQVYRQVEGNCC